MPDSFTPIISFLMDGIRSLLQGWLVKAAVASVIALVGPIQDGYVALMMLMLLDLVLGIARAIKEGNVSGRVARYKTVIKLMVYWSVIAASHQLSIIMGEDISVRVAVFYLGASEFLSVYRNGMAVLGRPPLPPSLINDIHRRIGEEEEE